MRPPFKRKTIIGVVDWLLSHPNIGLVWTGHRPAREDEWTNPCGMGIDGADAIAIMADEAAFNATVNDAIAASAGEGVLS